MEAAAEAAWATGKTFHIGVRAHNGSWFAHCDDIEHDGSDPESATYSVIRALKDRAHSQAASANAAVAAASQREAQLTAIAVPPMRDDG